MRHAVRSHRCAVFGALFLLVGCSTAARKATLVSGEIPSQLPADVRPLRYAVSVTPDPAGLRFDGHVDIDVEVGKATDSITLNAFELDVRTVSLAAAAKGTATKLAPADVRTDPARQTLTLGLGRTLAPGRYVLSIDYAGKINTQAAGLFALDYETAAGESKRALFTQFEAPHARRFLPCWDEPQFRTPYDLTVAVPPGQNAIGNMPEARRESRTDGGTRVTFGTTPPMSSYLLFLAVGEFDRIATRAADTEVGIVTRRGAGEQGRWALDSAALILPWYNDYFGTPYPLPKLDNVAGPGASEFFGAMENWGAILTFEHLLLVDPAITSEEQRQSIFAVAAHEMAHQWFGNLVTMAWWDDLWLNEGFASWLETKATAALHPEWEPLLDRVGGRERAAELDSLATTHPIVQRIDTVDQINQAFDAITYQKGEAVIAMLEDYVGEDAWRRGVRSYMARHRLGNTVTDDLWRAVGEAADRPVTAIARDFTLQPGVPLIRVEAARHADGQTRVTVRQGEFSRDHPEKKPLAWRVPVVASAGGEPTRALVRGDAPVELRVAGDGPLVVNYGQAGYYRTLYAPELIARLTEHYPKLRPIDQIGLLADNWALGLAGYQSPEVPLRLIAAAPVDGNSRLLSRIARILSSLHREYAGKAARQALVAQFADEKLSPALRRLGWSARPDEPANDAVLRAELIETLGTLGDADVLNEARRRFDEGDASATAGPLRETILQVVAFHADAARWDRLRAMAQAEKSPLVRSNLYRLLGAPLDATLARRALELALTDEPGATNSSQIISAVARWHPDAAFDFAVARHERVSELVDASSRSEFVAELASSSVDPAMLDKLEDYAKRYVTPDARAAVDRPVASIRDHLRTREEQLPRITSWLEARPVGAAK